MTETEALEKVLDGETECYAQLFCTHGKRAYALAFHYLRSKEDAMDIVQDSFIKAFQSLHSFDRTRSFAPWLMAIVRNLALDSLRARRENSDDEATQGWVTRRSPEAEVLKSEVWTAVSKLRVEERETVFLRDYLGHGYREISEIMKVPIGTVMSRLHRARKELARFLLEGSHDVRRD
jgi:RNA polymerase sigma-70 factor, ECF subfamily